MDYQPTIGLEIHAELKTRTKMFCDSLNDPDEKHPNTNVCPVCLGHPGTLPTINKQAVRHVIKVGLALGGKINPITKFDRKNYFYPDLPKGYQISQYDQPLVLGGELNGARITRVHLEEDTGTLIHLTSDKEQLTKSKKSDVNGQMSGASLVDFNRAGVPLMELVTEPDIKSAEEAVAFARELQLILRYLEVSDADMEKGQLRIEANVSLRPKFSISNSQFSNKLGNKVELKNINSFRFAKEAIEYEIKRQKEALEKGEEIKQETRGWDEKKQKTVSQRSKEEAHDYRYFPEPDLPPFDTSIFDLEKLQAEIPELPAEKRKRFGDEYGLDDKQAGFLLQDKTRAEYFEEADSELMILWQVENRYRNEEIKQGVLRNARGRVYSYLVNDLQGLINSHGDTEDVGYDMVPPKNLATLAFLVEFGVQGPLGMEEGTEIGRAATKAILEEMYSTGADSEAILNKKNKEGDGIYTISDEAKLARVVEEVVEENPVAVADYKKGKIASLQFLVGKAMAKLRGRGNPEKLKEMISSILG